MANINKNISWVEPNFIYKKTKDILVEGEEGKLDTNQDIIYETTPPMENYCIAVDLEVEIMNRNKGGITEPARTILISWNSSDKKSNVSFFEGTKYEYNGKSINYLTSAPTTFGTFDEVKKQGTNECFGINSIDIQYNSYMVPEITIEFTDIRGISLFSPEEFRHEGINDEGIGGMVEHNKHIAGSFFKCFFTFPYPRFKMMVKGFYGEPTTYELTVADFRTRFDCNTGNFNATAKFIGYAYSLLNDVTMNALVVAPLCEYTGKEYWDTKVKDEVFVFTDDTPMIKIDEVIRRTSNIKGELEKIASDSIQAQKAKDLSITNNKITNVLHAHDNFFICMTRYFASFKLDGVNNPLIDEKNKNFVFFLRKENKSKITVTDEVKNAFKQLKTVLIEYGNNLGSNLINKYENDYTYTILEYVNEIDNIKHLFKDYASQIGIDFSTSKLDDWEVIIYKGSELNDQITSIKNKNANEIAKNQDEISKINKQVLIDALGFNPSVENMTKLIFAHFETLLHCIYHCAETIQGRKASDIGIITTDISDMDNVGPFPRIDVKTIRNGIESVEEGWLGDFAAGVNEQEVQLVEALLKAVDEFNKTVNEAEQNLLNSDNTPDYNTSMQIPVIPLDILMKTNPYGDEIDFNNISDFIGKVALRMFSVLTLNEGLTSTSDYKKMGTADAYNFYAKFPKVSKIFLEKLCGSSEVINANFMLSCLRDINKEEKINGKWAWDDNDSDSVPLMVNKDLAICEYKDINNNSSKVIPISNLNWENISKFYGIVSENNEIKKDNLPSNFADFVSTSYIKDKHCPNIFKLDKNYANYSGFATRMSVDNEPFDYVEDLKLTFDAKSYLEEFFYDDGKIFNYKLSYENSELNFNPYQSSHLIPSERYLTELDAVNSKSFKNKNKLDNNFYEFNYKINDREKNVDRKGKGSFSNASTEIENIQSFTVPTFRGIEDGDSFTDSWSLFGQLDYYDIPTEEGKALAFLDTLKLKEEWKNSGGVRFDNYIGDGDKNIICHINNSSEPFMIMPYCGLLLLGGYYWREQYIKKYESEPLGEFINKNRRCNYKESITYSIDNDINIFDNIRQEIKDVLIKEFEDWVGNDSYGFKMFKSNFELKPKSGIDLSQKKFVELLINELNKNENEKNVELFLYHNADDSVFANYISFKVNEGKLKLFNRETSSAMSKFTNFYLKPYMVIKPTKYIHNDNLDRVTIEGDPYTYLNAFLSKLKELYKKNYETSKQEEIFVTPIKTSEHIKNSLYKYLKILYDKWLSGTKEKEWSLDKFYSLKWHFIDSFYNKIGDRIMINMVDFMSDVIYSQKESGYSLLSFLSKVYADNRFNLHCVQNFMDLSKQEEDEKFHKMFKAIPYNEIDFKNINIHPSFIVMYTYEYSSKLDIKGADFKNDSFNLDEEDWTKLPTQITTKRLDNGYRIPAFAVSYGKQYQHYFKNIDVSTDNPIVTEEAIKAQFMIASMNSKNGENGKKIDFLGQDLYTIYSNNSYTCTVKMMGCAWIQPLMYFQLNNIPMFRGAYLIQKVSHHIEPGNMETTFVGVRMAKQTTKLIDEPIFGQDNDQVAPQANEIVENTLADVTNDCEYAFYNPNVDLESTSMPNGELQMNKSEYQSKYGNFNSTVPEFNSVEQFLANILNGEARNQNRLGRELVAVVLFNRYMHFGKNLTKMFWDSQHEFGDSNNNNEENLEIIRKIFTNSPMCLKGVRTFVSKSIPIYNNGIETSNKTVSVELTEHMLKSIDGYCTIRGYDVKGNHNGPKEPKGWWHNAEYCCQHDSENAWGHVFVAGAWTKGKEHWQQKENISEHSENSNPSEKAVGLFNSIKKTIETSKSVTLENISMEKDKNGDRNVFYIIAKPDKAMIDIFDATVNTYYDYFSECNWIVNNDGKETPKKIRIKTNEEKNSEKSITISTLNNDGTVRTFPTHEELNQFFYMTLQKKYGKIDTNNKEIFKTDCKNFITLASKDSDWVNKTNNLLNNKIEPCGGEVNLPIVNGYQWDGSEHSQNKNKPSIPFKKKSNARSTNIEGYDPIKAADFAKNRANTSSIGACARYVREAMQMAGAGSMDDRPHSACAYSKFMEFWGFTKVYEGFGPSTEGYSPTKGDVAVIAGTDTKKHGHIHIYNDGKWYSDFGANTVFCYKDNGRPYIVYRWIENNISNV